MKTLKIKKTILPEERFESPQQWLESIGVKHPPIKDYNTIESKVQYEDYLLDVRNRFFSDPGVLQYCFAYPKTKNT